MVLRWIFLCEWRFARAAHEKSHTSHWKGFSPVWIFICSLVRGLEQFMNTDVFDYISQFQLIIKSLIPEFTSVPKPLGTYFTHPLLCGVFFRFMCSNMCSQIIFISRCMFTKWAFEVISFNMNPWYVFVQWLLIKDFKL